MTNKMKGAGLPEKGRTIVMTDGLNLAPEMVAAARRGMRVTGWDYDQPNDTAYIYTVPASPMGAHLSPIEKLAAWFSGRRNLRASLAQKGGVA